MSGQRPSRADKLTWARVSCRHQAGYRLQEQAKRARQHQKSEPARAGEREDRLTVRLEERAEGVEEPAVRVDLLGVLLLETEHDLAGHDCRLALCAKVVRVVGRQGKRGRVLEEVRLDGQVARAGRLHQTCRAGVTGRQHMSERDVGSPRRVPTLLVNTQCGEHIEYLRMHLLPAVGDNADDHLKRDRGARSDCCMSLTALGQGRTFFQPSRPQLEFCRAQRWLMFFMTP